MPNQDFFAAAVQVIPVLFLVLALEARHFQSVALARGWEQRFHEPEIQALAEGISEQELRRTDLELRVAATLFVSYVTVAEVVGFLALLTERETLRWIAVVVVLLAIVLLLFRIAAVALTGTIRPREREESETEGTAP